MQVLDDALNIRVLPLAREWIEIASADYTPAGSVFSLLRGSGLKLYRKYAAYKDQDVLPLAREWIEIPVTKAKIFPWKCCSPSCEGVD